MPDPIGDYAASLLAAVESATGLTGYLAPGTDVAWDSCCDSGPQLWVRVVTVFSAHTNLDTSLSPIRPCPQMWAVTFGLGFVTCVHVIDDQGNPPDPALVTEDTLFITQTASALLYAALCDWIADPMRIENGLPLGPEGGCAGWEWQVTAGFSCQECA